MNSKNDLFFHSETNLKVLLARLGIDPRPRRLGAPQPWLLQHRTNCLTATLFSFYLIGFFHSETNVKELLALLGIDPRPLGLGAPQPWPLHHRANCWTATFFSFYLIGFFHSETNVKNQLNFTLRLFKGLEAQARNRFSLLRLWAP